MAIRTCTHCGWQHPSAYDLYGCRCCGKLLEDQLCSHCDTWKKASDFNMREDGKYRRGRCKDCDKAYYRQHEKNTGGAIAKRAYAKKVKVAEELYEAWKAKSQVPFKPMTEAEWQACCAFFEGCAVCGAEYIETRQFFMQFENGGKYAAWNVIPMCGSCSTKMRTVENPFKYFRAHYIPTSRERADKIIEWLTMQIEKAGVVVE